MPDSSAVATLARDLPKAELHVHIEGTLEPELMLLLAKRHGVELAYPDVDAVRAAYEFTDLQSFLDLYYQGAAVLMSEQDFSDLAAAYLERAAADNVRRVEMFFDPQTHTDRGIPFEAVMDGLLDGIERSRSLGIDAALILCFLRHLSEAAAFEALESAESYRTHILGVGLDSSEIGNPPSKFERVFAAARDQGYRQVAHAGEEGPPQYVWDSLDLLGAERIDHGIRSLEDEALTARLAAERIPLTVCPLSNRKLQVTPNLAQHPLPQMIDAGIPVSINSDDPSYFGGYIGENYAAAAEEMAFDAQTLAHVARSSFESAFLPDEEKQRFITEVNEVLASHEAAAT